MKDDITITIDGHELEFNPGDTILDVALRNNIFIPTLCYLKGASPTGACRMCVVEVEKARAFAAACTTPASRGMVVHTHSPKIVETRRNILALLLASGNHNCSAQRKDSSQWTAFQQQVAEYDQSQELCEVYGDCKLQSLAYRYQADSSTFSRPSTPYPIEMASPLILRDFSRCILCGRCVQACNEIQVNNAISHGFRGAKVKIVAMGDGSLERSDCVFCGECIQSCPVGALVEKRSRYKIRPWEARHVRTTCPYCSIGCQLDLQIKDNTIMKVAGVAGAEPNFGRLCVKGRFGFDFLGSPRRLTTPLIRENGKLRQASWDEALDRVAGKIKEVREQHGADAIAAVASAKSTNESLYLLQKLVRAAIGTNNLTAPFAGTGMSNSLAELGRAANILLIASDVTEENPVAGTFIKQAVKRGAKLIVVDSAETKITTFATLHLPAREGTESVLVNGVIHELFERAAREGFDEIRETALSFPLEKVSETTGVAAGPIREAAALLDVEEPVMLVYGAKVCGWAPTFANLQAILGNLEKECGGINCLSDLNNSQGACDMGLLPQYLPGYRSVTDASARAIFEQAWSCQLSATPGLGLDEIFAEPRGDGERPAAKIKFLYCAGENPALAEPAAKGIRAALAATDFVVVQDILENETAEYADVVLPAAGWSEAEGTFTSCERRVNRVRRAVEPPGEAKPETWIYTELARRLGQDWPTRTSQEIWEQEITPLVPQLAGSPYERIEQDGMQWPVPDVSSPGTDRLDGEGPPLCRAAWASFNYHHRTLLEQCQGLLESLPRTGGIGTRTLPSDPEQVTREFVEVLEKEECPEAKEKIDAVLATYRNTRGGLIPVLQQVQGILGFLPVPVQNYIAQGLELSAADVFGVVSFYSFFTMVPRGRHVIRLCLGTACFVKGAGKLLENLLWHLKIEVGETTEDREYSLEAVRCVGACGLAPVMVVDEVTHGQVKPAEIVEIVENYRGVLNEA
jgi:formate dehydrogenase major subunit